MDLPTYPHPSLPGCDQLIEFAPVHIHAQLYVVPNAEDNRSPNLTIDGYPN